MPQKKNPDAAELLRAKAPRVASRLVGVHGVLHGLPLTYNKDLQEDKEPLFDAIDTLELCLRVAREMLAGIEFHRERMAEAASDELIAATDVTDLLVRHGVPFREAHGIVGRLVRAAEELGCGLDELDARFFTHLSPHFEGAGFETLFSAEAALAARGGIGGTSPEAVGEQIAALRSIL
jgi:argininosuccinate lyase